MPDLEEIASKVLGMAALLDTRIPNYDPAAVKAWAFVFDGHPMYLNEALDAVKAHYAKPNPFPIKPGDVIEHVKKLPVDSSPERMWDEVRKWSQYPYSGRVQALTGIDWEPTFPTPEGIHGDPAKEKQFHVDELMDHVYAHQMEIDMVAAQAHIPRQIGSGR